MIPSGGRKTTRQDRRAKRLNAFFSRHFFWKDVMTYERRLLTAGMPRREGTLPEFIENQEKRHVCKCGGNCSCPDCPNKNK
jgi:hypothetical protein